MGKISVVLLVLVSGCSGFENTSNPNKVYCNYPVRIIWGIAVIPKCTSNGSYIDLKTGHGYDSNDYPIIVKFGRSRVRFKNNILDWKTSYFTSNASQVELTFSVEP